MILINKDRKGLFFFTVKSSNGQILCHSEGYTRKANCLRAIVVLENELVTSASLNGYYEGKIIDNTNGVKK